MVGERHLLLVTMASEEVLSVILREGHARRIITWFKGNFNFPYGLLWGPM